MDEIQTIAALAALDGNEAGGRAGGYHRFVGPAQLAWLSEQLARLDRPALVLIHQPMDHDKGGLENGAAVRAVLRDHNQQRTDRPVLAVVSGHLHQDYVRVVDDLTCLQINSASYYWVGGSGKPNSYFPPEVQKSHPYVNSVAAYRDPLWALLEVDLAAGELRVRGRTTEWIGPPAAERGVPANSPDLPNIRPAVSDRVLCVAPPRPVS